MPLLFDAERPPAEGVKGRRCAWGATIEIWNEKLHYYFGLYLLLFIGLFSFTGLLLNHQWEIHNFWEKRKESTSRKKCNRCRGIRIWNRREI